MTTKPVDKTLIYRSGGERSAGIVLQGRTVIATIAITSEPSGTMTLRRFAVGGDLRRMETITGVDAVSLPKLIFGDGAGQVRVTQLGGSSLPETLGGDLFDAIDEALIFACLDWHADPTNHEPEGETRGPNASCG